MKPPLTDPPPDLEWGTDYDTPQTYARIGRALMLFLFNAAIDGNSKEHIAWLCEGVNQVNGAASAADDEEEPEDATVALVEWRCGWCGAENGTAKAKAPCKGNGPRRVIRP